MNANESDATSLVPFEFVLRVTFYLSVFVLLSTILFLAGHFVRRGHTVGLTVLAALAAVIFHWVFTVCPSLVEQIMNRSDLPLPNIYRELAKNSSTGFIAAADLHSDALLWLRRDLLKRSSVGHVDLPRLEQGRMRLQVFSIVVAVPRGMNLLSNVRPSTLNHDMLFPKMLLERWPLSSYRSHLQRALIQCDRLHRISSKSDGRLEVTMSAQQLQHEEATSGKEQQHITHAILALEGASALENDMSNIDTLFNAGLRVIGPTHFFDTEFGGAQSGVQKSGLTEFGRKALIRMRDLDMVVDLAHSSNMLIEDVVAVPADQRPCLLLSHTGVRSVCDSERNVDDDHLRMISAADGIVGIALFYPALCDKDDLLGSFVKSVVHAIRTIGVEHVAVGSDFDGGVHTSVDASDMRVIFAALVHFGGLSALEAHMVIYQNSLDFFRRCLPKS